MHKRYRDDLSTYSELNLNLWLEVGFTGGSDGNQVYNFSKTTIEDVRAGHSVLIVGASWSRSSQQSLTVQAIIQEYVQAETTQLGAKRPN